MNNKKSKKYERRSCVESTKEIPHTSRCLDALLNMSIIHISET